MFDAWGFGNADLARPCGTAYLGDYQGTKAQLFFGEHPHSRSDNNLYAKGPGDTIYAFDGHRVLLDIVFKSRNYLKESGLSGNEIRKAITCTILADGEPVYSFSGRDMVFMLGRAQQLSVLLGEHSSNILLADERARLPGRKIYYREVPALIARFIGEQGCVILQAAPGHQFLPPIYMRDDDRDDDDIETTVKEDILSPHIWWHRH